MSKACNTHLKGTESHGILGLQPLTHAGNLYHRLRDLQGVPGPDLLRQRWYAEECCVSLLGACVPARFGHSLPPYSDSPSWQAKIDQSPASAAHPGQLGALRTWSRAGVACVPAAGSRSCNLEHTWGGASARREAASKTFVEQHFLRPAASNTLVFYKEQCSALSHDHL